MTSSLSLNSSSRISISTVQGITKHNKNKHGFRQARKAIERIFFLAVSAVNMALSCVWRKQRWEKGGGGHRHFHIHYHLPRRVSTFSPLRLWPRFSLLSSVLIPLVLFFAVLALVVLFVWFTLLCYVVSLLSKNSNHDSFQSDGMGPVSDVSKHRRDDGGQEGKVETKAVRHVAGVTEDSVAPEVCVRSLKIKQVIVDGFCEKPRRTSTSDACLNHEKLVQEVIIFETNREELNSSAALDGSSESSEVDGNSAAAEVCVKRLEINDLRADGFSEEAPNVSKMASSGSCLDYQEQINADEQLEEATIFETKREEKNVNGDLDGLSERHLVQDVPVDRFVDEVNIREVATSIDSLPILLSTTSGEFENEQYNLEFFDDRKGRSTCTSSEICEFIDKHETREVVRDRLSNDDQIGLLDSSDYSAHDVIGDEQKKENTEKEHQKNELESLADTVTTAHVFDQHQKIQKVVLHDKGKLPQVKRTVGTSDEIQDFTNKNETSDLSLDPVCEDKKADAAFTEHDELIENNIEEESGTASVVHDFAENHQAPRGALHGCGNDDNTGEVASQDSSLVERIEDKDNTIDYNSTTKGASSGLPLVRRSPAPWWNLCGVLEVLGGCEH